MSEDNPESREWVVRRMCPDDIEAVVLIHQSVFQDSFLSSLGKRFLSALYAAIISDSHGISLVALNSDGQVIGFSSGTRLLTGLWFRLVFGNRGRVLRVLIRLGLRSPNLVWASIRRVFVKHRLHASVPDSAAWLLSIAVEINGRGLGSKLLRAFEGQAGQPLVALETDLGENDVVIKFYNRNGYELVAQPHHPSESKRGVFMKEINNA